MILERAHSWTANPESMYSSVHLHGHLHAAIGQFSHEEYSSWEEETLVRGWVNDLMILGRGSDPPFSHWGIQSKLYDIDQDNVECNE